MRTWSRIRLKCPNSGDRNCKTCPTSAAGVGAWQSCWRRRPRRAETPRKGRPMRRSFPRRDQEIDRNPCPGRRRGSKEEPPTRMPRTSRTDRNSTKGTTRSSPTSSKAWDRTLMTELRSATLGSQRGQDSREVPGRTAAWPATRRRSCRPTEWSPRIPSHLNRRRKTNDNAHAKKDNTRTKC